MSDGCGGAAEDLKHVITRRGVLESDQLGRRGRDHSQSAGDRGDGNRMGMPLAGDTDEGPIHFACRQGSRVLALLWAAVVLPLTLAAQVLPQPVWTRTTDGTGYTAAGAMALDAAGNVYVCGADERGYLTVKLAPTGNVLWSSRAAGRDGYRECNAIVVDDAGGAYVTGGLSGQRSFTLTYCSFDGCQDYRLYSPDMATIHYDDRGHRQWEDDYFETAEGHFVGGDLAVDPGGNVYVVGYTISIPPVGTIYVTGTRTLKYSAAGGLVWVRTNTLTSWVPLSGHGRLAVLDHAGNLCLTGAAGTRKLDSDGNELWSASPVGAVLLLDDADNVYVTADNATGPTTKLDPIGNVKWTAPFGGAVMALDDAGNLYIADFRSAPGRADYVTTKLDGQGQPVWRAINDSTSGIEYPTALAADPDGSVYLSGYSGTVKYDPDGIRVWRIPTQLSSYGQSLIVVDADDNIIVAGGTTTGGFLITKFAQLSNPGAPVIDPPPHQPLVRPGDTVTLSVDVTGDGPLGYQWRSGPGLLPNATNATLTLSNLQASAATNYSVEVTNAFGSAASPQIFVSVLSPLPSQTVVLGATALFRVPLSGGGPAAYQWRFNGADLPGQTHSTVAITNVGLDEVGDYEVVVSNFYGNALTSTVAHLFVDTHVVQSWAATEPGANVGDVGQAIGVDAAGNVFVAGYAGCGHKTVKYDATGLKLWEACDGNFGTLGGLAVDAAGNVCVAGGSSARKYAAAGTPLWTAHFDDGAGSSNDVAIAIAGDAAGNFYITGTSASGPNGTDILTAKYSPTGQQLWAVRYDGDGHSDDFPEAIQLDGSGNILVCGAGYGPNEYDFRILKYGPNGNLVWDRSYDGPTSGRDIASRLTADQVGSIYVTGWSRGEDYYTDFATIKYDAGGNRLWVARYSGPGNGEDNPHGVGVDAAGNVYVTGSSVGEGPVWLYDIATVKYAPDGTELWARRYSGPEHRNDYSRALALDAAGNVYIEGHSDSGPGTGPGAPSTEVVTLSYDSAGTPRWVARCETGVESGNYYRNGSMQVGAGGTVYVADTTFLGGSPAYLTLRYAQQLPATLRLAIPIIEPNGQVRCSLTGNPGGHYTIQVSVDAQNWTSLTSGMTDAGGSAEFTDTMTSGPSRRFYRVTQP